LSNSTTQFVEKTAEKWFYISTRCWNYKIYL